MSTYCITVSRIAFSLLFGSGLVHWCRAKRKHQVEGRRERYDLPNPKDPSAVRSPARSPFFLRFPPVEISILTRPSFFNHPQSVQLPAVHHGLFRASFVSGCLGRLGCSRFLLRASRFSTQQQAPRRIQNTSFHVENDATSHAPRRCGEQPAHRYHRL